MKMDYLSYLPIFVGFFGCFLILFTFCIGYNQRDNVIYTLALHCDCALVLYQKYRGNNNLTRDELMYLTREELYRLDGED